MVTFSVVIPAFNESENLSHLIDEIARQLDHLGAYEIIVVDDGSTDDTLCRLREMYKSRPYLRFSSFSRNFGHQPALRAGLQRARGECIISMDADFQHPPTLLPEMIEAWRAGAEIVIMVRDGQEKTGVTKQVLSSALMMSHRVV